MLYTEALWSIFISHRVDRKSTLTKLPLSTKIQLTSQFIMFSVRTNASPCGRLRFVASLLWKVIECLTGLSKKIEATGWRTFLRWALIVVMVSPLNTDPPQMISMVFRTGSGDGVSLIYCTILRSFGSLLSLYVSHPFSVRNSRRCPFFNSSAISARKALQSIMWCPWSLCNSQYFVISQVGSYGNFFGHVTYMWPLKWATCFEGLMLKAYFGGDKGRFYLCFDAWSSRDSW